MSASEVPVLLGRICSAWRAISLSTPRLWASLHIVRPGSPLFESQTALEMYEQKCALCLATMKAWLSRSGDCALAISLDDGVDFKFPTESHIASRGSLLYLQALIPFASHWREIKFTNQAPILIEALQTLTASDVPVLQDIAIFERPQHGSSVWPSVGMLSGPALSKLSLTVVHLLGPAQLPVQWSRLTSLTLKNLSVDPFHLLGNDDPNSPHTLTTERA
ncbi:hypothetical protein DFH06DRAFT_1198118 [Mycena polygramma]|nr:hypothetical protein DFH06DRAFT_1198118 [Mycena polygramma]